MNDPLSKALGIIPADNEEILDKEIERRIDANLPDAVKAEDDANFARETLYDMIKKTNKSIEELMKVAAESMSARHYEVLGQLININTAASEKLLKIQADHQKVQNNAINLVRNKGGGKAAPNAINIQNAVFAGTTSDLLKLIKSTQEKQIIEMDKNDDE